MICDGCGQHYLLEADEDMPPYWFAMQIIVADGEGMIPINERESFVHFCSQDCVVEYCKGDSLREFAALVDNEVVDDPPRRLDEEGDEDVEC
jgi:hypothetical protein